MNPSERGWLVNYINYRADHPINIASKNIEDKNVLLYKTVQPTGLIYGHPVHSPSLRHPKERRWNSLGKMKVVLLESFFYSALLKGQQLPKTKDEWKSFYWENGQSIGSFYQQLNPTVVKKPFYYFSSPKADPLKQAERALRKNLFLQSRWDYFWASLFHHSLLFLDAYYFGEWRAGKFGNIKWHKDAMKILLLRVLAAAAHSNHIIEREERNMFFSFLTSANLTPGQQRLAKEAFADGITLDEIDLRHADNWLLKKYVLELAILMIWSDQIVTHEERSFLNKLAAKLGFTETELDISLIAIESFVVENWKDVYFMQSKHSFDAISETMLTRLKLLVEDNKANIIQAVSTCEPLNNLLEKSNKQVLTADEKEVIRIQLINILRNIPAFDMIALPATFQKLPFLHKILPKEVKLPASFLI